MTYVAARRRCGFLRSEGSRGMAAVDLVAAGRYSSSLLEMAWSILSVVARARRSLTVDGDVARAGSSYGRERSYMETDGDKLSFNIPR